MWIKNLAGEKATIDDADREYWGLRGWSPALPPVDGDFVWMARADVANPGLWAWGARDYTLAIGWVVSKPPEPVDPTRDPALTDVQVTVPDGPAADVTDWVGDDRDRAELALSAELTRPKPRKSLVDDLNKVGQPQDDAAPAASNKEA